MKKIISVVLIFSLTISLFAATAFAQSADKLDTELVSLSDSDGGAVVSVRHHYDTVQELYDAIEAISYYEAHPSLDGVAIVGLPYRSLSNVAALEKVDYVSIYEYTLPEEVKPEDKQSKSLSETLTKLDPDDSVNVAVWLAYSDYIYYGFSEKDYSDVDEYIKLLRETSRRFFVEKNQEYLSLIQENIVIDGYGLSRYTPSIRITVTASQIPELANLSEVYYLDYLGSDSADINVESDRLYYDRFNSYMNTAGHIQYDPELHGGDKWLKYADYDELWYQYGAQGKLPEWCLITAKVDCGNDTERVEFQRVGDRVLVGAPGAAYPYDLFLYDASEEKFVIFSDIRDLSKYDGLTDAIEKLELGFQIGDADMSGEVDIIDVTFVQRMLTGIMAPRYSIYREVISLISDLNGDGLDITDVTRLQRKVTLID